MTDTPEKVIYTARATAVSGREGRATSDDGILDLALAAPKETGGPGGAANPEMLFAAGYAACFGSALGVVARKEGIDASNAPVTAAVGLGPSGGAFALTVELRAEIADVDDVTAQRLVEAAHEVCPYSRATRGNVPITVKGVAA